MYLDIYKPPTSEFRTGRPEGIIVTHSIDLFFKGEVDSKIEMDTYKMSFDKFSKYSYARLKLLRFPSHYFIEQINEAIVPIVGTGLHLTSEYLKKYISPSGLLDGFIFIVIAGDYSRDIPMKETYIRVGNVISSILYTYKMSGKGSNVFTLEEAIELFDLKNDIDKRVNLVKMKSFKKSELNMYIR